MTDDVSPTQRVSPMRSEPVAWLGARLGEGLSWKIAIFQGALDGFLAAHNEFRPPSSGSSAPHWIFGGCQVFDVYSLLPPRRRASSAAANGTHQNRKTTSLYPSAFDRVRLPCPSFRRRAPGRLGSSSSDLRMAKAYAEVTLRTSRKSRTASRFPTRSFRLVFFVIVRSV